MKQFLFLNNDSKDGSSFILTINKGKVYLATENGEWECLDGDDLLKEIYCDCVWDKIEFLGVL